jgi:hypothetical protein
MICEKTSLPTPLSPLMRTLKSVLATCAATFNAWLSAGELPIIPKRFLIDCKSIMFSSGPLKSNLELFNLVLLPRQETGNVININYVQFLKWFYTRKRM